jgi:cobalt/nickel transport system permease protein
MHIPDGFLDAKTALATGVLAAGGVGLALWQAKRSLQPRQVPLLGVTAAFVFAAQMLNFPVLPVVSGHLLGTVLAAVLLGPAGAVIALTAVLAVQCFLFQDGGVTALGANIFNMAVAGTITGYGVYRLARRWLGLAWSAAIAGWCATVISAILCAAELAWSDMASWRVLLPAMMGIHAVIGLAEGAITALVLVAIARRRPELVEQPTTTPWSALALGLVVAIGLAWFVSPFACQWPDGLEQVALTLGFDHQAVP